MLDSPLSSLNKQLNWEDLLIIYRMESRGGYCFLWATQTQFVPWQAGFVFRNRSELVGQINQQLDRGFRFLNVIISIIYLFIRR